MPRTAKVVRNTKETQISGELRIEGRGRYEISTGIRYFDHMLELFTKHGGFYLKIDAKGDLDVDQHHTVEDVGILIGQLFSKALGDRKGINRAGYFVLPMDETTLCSRSRSGRTPGVGLQRSGSSAAGRRSAGRAGGRLLRRLRTPRRSQSARRRFFTARSSCLYHKIEAIYKCWARAMRYACSTDARLKDLLPSTKGLL